MQPATFPSRCQHTHGGWCDRQQLDCHHRIGCSSVIAIIIIYHKTSITVSGVIYQGPASAGKASLVLVLLLVWLLLLLALHL